MDDTGFVHSNSVWVRIDSDLEVVTLISSVSAGDLNRCLAHLSGAGYYRHRRGLCGIKVDGGKALPTPVCRHGLVDDVDQARKAAHDADDYLQVRGVSSPGEETVLLVEDKRLRANRVL